MLHLARPNPAQRRRAPVLISLLVALLCVAPASRAQLALKGPLLLEENFRTVRAFTKEGENLREGWKVRVAHAAWERTDEGVRSLWTTGHMPVLVLEGSFGDAIIEVDFRYTAEPGKWAACRVSATNRELNPRAYAVSVWANQDNAARARGLVLEHDEWKPGHITMVDDKRGTFEPGKWYTLRLEIVGQTALAHCNGLSVKGTFDKFGLPKTSLWLGVGTCPHELKNLRIFAAKPNPGWNGKP